MEWLAGSAGATAANVSDVIRDRGTAWLARIARPREVPPAHSFVLAVVKDGEATLTVISNFDDCVGRTARTPRSKLSSSTRKFRGRPIVILTGSGKRAVDRLAIRRLRYLAGRSDEPARIRRRLAEINAQAATADSAVSKGCAVVSFRLDGRGTIDVSGDTELRSVMSGMPMPTRKELARMLGFDPGLPIGMTFASSHVPLPFEACRPRPWEPGDSGRYELKELQHKQFGSAQALAVNDAGAIAGIWSPAGGSAVEALWIGTQAHPSVHDIQARPAGINAVGQVALTAKMKDDDDPLLRDRAAIWGSDGPRDLGSFRGKDSGAVAINDAGMVAGWVCLDADDRGQRNFRPAAWSREETSVLDQFACDWGQAVAVNNAGAVLVVGYVGMQTPRAIIWFPRTGEYTVVGGAVGIYPAGLTSDGVVLGNARDSNANHVAFLARPDGDWEPLGTPPGYHANVINDRGEVAGTVTSEGFGWSALAPARVRRFDVPSFLRASLVSTESDQ